MLKKFKKLMKKLVLTKQLKMLSLENICTNGEKKGCENKKPEMIDYWMSSLLTKVECKIDIYFRQLFSGTNF